MNKLSLALILLLFSLPGVATEIRGTLRMDNGDLCTRGEVSLEGQVAKTSLEPSGHFRLTHIAPGKQVLLGHCPGGLTGRLEIDIPDSPSGIEVELRVQPTQITESVDVSSRYSLLREDPVGRVGLDREQIFLVPHFGDDMYRAIRLLPGVTGSDISARFQVRGSDYQDVQVVLDGTELYNPFHLQDFQGVFSILDGEIIGGVDLLPGTFPAEYGRRSAAVLEMTSFRPRKSRTNMGLSFSNAWLGSSGLFADDRGRWIANARRGYLDILLRISEGDDDENPSPQYWDFFGKLDYDLSPSQSLSFKALAADDTIDFSDTDDDEVLEADTQYGSTYAWLSHLGMIGSQGVVQSHFSWTELDRDRNFDFLEPPESLVIFDQRETEVLGFKQDWTLASFHHLLKFGVDARRFESRYDYRNDVVNAFPIDIPGFPPGEFQETFFGDFESDTLGLYLADRMHWGRWTLELGARWDDYEILDEDEITGRLNLAVDLQSRGILRLGWGQFGQTQQPFELNVEFGETDFQPSQVHEHWSLGWENRFSRGILLKAEIYRRDRDEAGRRFETVFEPFTAFPEAMVDRLAVTTDRRRAEGAELYFGVHGTGRWQGWFTYSYASVEDQIQGQWIPVPHDQTHAFTGSLAWRFGRKWSLTGVWLYHTGWPQTPLTTTVTAADDGEATLHYEVGKPYGDRLADYHRLDLRASYSTQLKRSRLTFFVDVQNLYNRENERGFEIDEPEFQVAPGETAGVTFPETTWLGILPSFGVQWEF